jgi:hypothetical protein
MAITINGSTGISGVDGDATTPALQGSDTNTGISFGTDEVRINTGGTQRAVVDANGRLGLGTSTARAGLTVARGSNGIPAVGTTDGSAVFSNAQDLAIYGLVLGAATTGKGYVQVQSTNGTSDVYDLLLQPNGGNVGIGTTSPGTPLHVAAQYPSIRLQSNSGSYQQRSTVGQFDNIMYIECDNDNAVASSAMAFTVDASEKMRIDSSGRLLVGTSTNLNSNALIQAYKSSGTLQVLADSDSLADSDFVSFSVNAGARAADFGVYKHSGITNPCAYAGLRTEDNVGNYLWVDNSDILRISTNSAFIGTTSGTVVGTQTSDERIKSILGPVEYGLDTLKQIEPVRFSLKSEPKTEKLGFIAQQVQPFIPQSVFDTGEHIEGEPEDAPTKLGMEYVALIPVLVNAVKELSAEVDALKAQLQAS